MSALIYRVTRLDGQLVAQGDIPWPKGDGSALDLLQLAAGELADQLDADAWVAVEAALSTVLDATDQAGAGGVCTLMYAISPPAPDPRTG